MRIISGEFGRRPLKAASGDHTRPTTDKIKESLFNLLGHQLVGDWCLDMYGGSGGLGIEAVSRGIKQAVICEYYRPALKVIEQNIQMTRATDRFIVLSGKNERTLKKFKQAHADCVFDYVFIDPPYQQADYPRDIHLLSELGLIDARTVIICESDQDHELPNHMANYVLDSHKVYGMTQIWIYKEA